MRQQSSDSRGRSQKVLMRLLGALVIMAAYLAASGCGAIQVTEATPSNPPPASVAPAPNTDEQHDVSIMAVDFEPPLSVESIVAGDPISLVVGVENSGNRRETNIQVRATLYNSDRSQTLMSSSKRIPSLAAGGVTVARFTQDQPPPRFDSYVLVVEISPVTRESNTANNRRVLNIEVRGAR